MTAPAPTARCKHCQTLPTVTHVKPAVPGARPVNLSLCDCDYLRCPHQACKKVLRGVPATTHTCPHCKGRL